MHPIDWHSMISPSMSLLELVLRGSAVYLGILIFLRFFRREAGALSTPDLLVIVLVADAAQNAMGSEYRSITEGLVLVATIFGWNYLLDWLAFRLEWMHRLLNPPPLLLVNAGRIQVRNLRSEMLTRADLMEQLREQGVEHPSQVKRCYLEGDGRLSIIRYEAEAGNPQPRERGQ